MPESRADSGAPPERASHPLVAALISERVVTAVIVINAIVLLIGDQLGLGLWPVWGIDFLCVGYFLLEAILKMRVAGVRAYFDSGWNRYDFAVLVLSLPVLLTPLIALHGVAAGPILRVGRLFRLFRLLRFIPNIDHLLTGIRRALRASVGVFLALLLVNIILAVTGHFLFGGFAPDLFGDPARATYTLFQMFTIEGWNEIPDRIVEGLERNNDPLLGFWTVIARLFSVVTVVVGGILGLSLANAVFVDEMTMDNNEELEQKVDELSARIDALTEAIKRNSP